MRPLRSGQCRHAIELDETMEKLVRCRNKLKAVLPMMEAECEKLGSSNSWERVRAALAELT